MGSPEATPSGGVVDFDSSPSAIDGLFVVRMKQVSEPRGVVREAFRSSTFSTAGLPAGPWQQINVTETRFGAIRGLHGEAAIKVVSVVSGTAFGAYLDTRPRSSTFGSVVTVDLLPGVQVIVPAGVCNGFQATSRPSCQYLYLFSDEWAPGMPGTAIHPLDPALHIDWPAPGTMERALAVTNHWLRPQWT